MKENNLEKNAPLNLVLLGRTGAGKSASGNTILGRQTFTSTINSKSVTQDVAVEFGTFCGIPVSVYDTPGLFDTELNEEEIQQKLEEVLQKCESGPCVFLLVIKVARFTEEERRTVEKIEELLGEKRLEKTWILFTGRDQLEEENMTIKEFIDGTEPLKRLAQKYEPRYHVFNNKKKEPSDQARLLLVDILQRSLGLNVTEGGRPPRQNPDIRNSDSDEQQTTDDSLSSRRIVLLGKTGVGKSAAGNTILGQKEFRSEQSLNSVTSKCSDAQATVSGRSVSVVDTPGLSDTRMKPEEIIIEIARSVYISSPGPHAFLIVFPVNMRFTDQEQQIPQIIEMLFGQEMLKYSIILFTHGDQLEEKSVEELIEGSCALRHLVQQCGGRFHVFNNKAQNNREQVNDLLQKIDSMIEQNGGGHYSNQMFEDALRFRREEEEERRLREEEERQREEEEMRQREEEERKQDEKQRQEEIEKVKKETEERVRADFEAERSELERLNVTRPREVEWRIQPEKQRPGDVERIEKGKVKPEITRSITATLAEKIETGWKRFVSMYGPYFSVASLAIGGAIIGGVIGGVAWGVAGAVTGGVGGAVLGAICGVLVGAVAGAAGGAIIAQEGLGAHIKFCM